jgi:hypothetical protein
MLSAVLGMVVTGGAKFGFLVYLYFWPEGDTVRGRTLPQFPGTERIRVKKATTCVSLVVNDGAMVSG